MSTKISAGGGPCVHCDSPYHGSAQHYESARYGGYVYCVHVSGIGPYAHKIGQTNNLARRMAQIAEIWGKVTLCWSIGTNDTIELEKLVHDILRGYRVLV